MRNLYREVRIPSAKFEPCDRNTVNGWQNATLLLRISEALPAVVNDLITAQIDARVEGRIAAMVGAALAGHIAGFHRSASEAPLPVIRSAELNEAFERLSEPGNADLTLTEQNADVLAREVRKLTDIIRGLTPWCSHRGHLCPPHLLIEAGQACRRAEQLLEEIKE